MPRSNGVRVSSSRHGDRRGLPSQVWRASWCTALWVAALSATSACDAPRPSKGDGPRLTITEAYGNPPTRVVKLEVTLVADGPQHVGLDDVSLTVEPPVSGTEKLAAILEDARLRRTEPSAWPTEAHMLPTEAKPLLRRIQLALWILDAPPRDATRERAEVDIFDDQTSLGLTRIRRQGSDVEVTTLGLGVAAGAGALGLAYASGSADTARADLRGVRRILGEPSEPVRFQFAREAPHTLPGP